MKEERHIVPSHVVEWFGLHDNIQNGKYKLPISCIIINGKNRGVSILDIKKERDELIIICDVGSLTVNEKNLIFFKYGKDAHGKPVLVSS